MILIVLKLNLYTREHSGYSFLYMVEMWNSPRQFLFVRRCFRRRHPENLCACSSVRFPRSPGEGKNHLGRRKISESQPSITTRWSHVKWKQNTRKETEELGNVARKCNEKMFQLLNYDLKLIHLFVRWRRLGQC